MKLSLSVLAFIAVGYALGRFFPKPGSLVGLP